MELIHLIPPEFFLKTNVAVVIGVVVLSSDKGVAVERDSTAAEAVAEEEFTNLDAFLLDEIVIRIRLMYLLATSSVSFFFFPPERTREGLMVATTEP